MFRERFICAAFHTHMLLLTLVLYITIRNGMTNDLYTEAEVIFKQTRRIDLSVENDANKLR